MLNTVMPGMLHFNSQLQLHACVGLIKLCCAADLDWREAVSSFCWVAVFAHRSVCLMADVAMCGCCRYYFNQICAMATRLAALPEHYEVPQLCACAWRGSKELCCADVQCTCPQEDAHLVPDWPVSDAAAERCS